MVYKAIRINGGFSQRGRFSAIYPENLPFSAASLAPEGCFSLDFA